MKIKLNSTTKWALLFVAVFTILIFTIGGLKSLALILSLIVIAALIMFVLEDTATYSHPYEKYYPDTSSPEYKEQTQKIIDGISKAINDLK